MGEGSFKRLMEIYLNKDSPDVFRGFHQKEVYYARTARDRGTAGAFGYILKKLQIQGWREEDGLVCHNESNDRGTTSRVQLDGYGIEMKIVYDKNQAGDRVFDAEVRKFKSIEGHASFVYENSGFKARGDEDTRLQRSLVDHLGIDNLTERKLPYVKAS